MLTSLHILKTTSNSVTLSWNDVVWTHTYKIVYHKVETNTTNVSINLSPYMHSYTITELVENSWYQFCVAVLHGSDLSFLNCTDIKTHSFSENSVFIKNYKNLIIGCSISLIIFISIIFILIKKFIQQMNLKFLNKNKYGDCFSETLMSSVNDALETELNDCDNFEDDGQYIEDYDKCDELQEMRMPLFKCTEENNINYVSY